MWRVATKSRTSGMGPNRNRAIVFLKWTAELPVSAFRWQLLTVRKSDLHVRGCGTGNVLRWEVARSAVIRIVLSISRESGD